MFSTASWLQKQRKSELLTLADKVGLRNYENLKKTDLEFALDQHIRANQTRLAKVPDLMPFYSRIAPRLSPIKREVITIPPPTVEARKPRPRRATRGPADMEPTDESESDPSKTALYSPKPRSSLGFASNMQLPPSPTVVADVIDQQTENLRSSVNKAWDRAHFTEYAESTRDYLSTVASIEFLALAVEAFGLRSEVLPMRYAFTIPANGALGTSDLPVMVPDLFRLLTSSFWSPFSLWLFTSLLLPLACAYFFNLTLKAKYAHGSRARGSQTSETDPLTFNVAKALIAWLVYSQGVDLGGLVGRESVLNVNKSVPGGYVGMMIGAGIGALTSIYEAVLKK